MAKIPPSKKFEKEWQEKMKGGGLSLPELILEGARMMLQRAVEEEVDEFLGRGYYQRCGEQEEFRGYRNGYESKEIATGEGSVQIQMPQVRDAKDRFKSGFVNAYLKRTETLNELVNSMYVRGMSQRDVEATMEEIYSGEGLSRTVISRITDKLQADFEVWQKRDLSGEEILYLFLDAAYWKVRDGSERKEAVMAAYGIREDGKKVLLHLSLGNKENVDSWLTFLHDMTERGLKQPLMVVYDGNPGVRKACREVFPDALKQRCQVHKMRNVLSRIPKHEVARMKVLIQKVFQAESYEKGLAAGLRLIERFRDRFSSAMECLEKDLEETLQCLKLPAAHQKRARTTNLLERLFLEAKRRSKVVPYFRTEKAGLKLLYGTLITASRYWRGVKMDRKIEREIQQLKAEIFKVGQAA